MTRELKFTAADMRQSSDEDCVLSPDDPVYQFLTPALTNTAYSSGSTIKAIAEQHFKERELAQQKGIRPGTPAWHAMKQQGL